MNKFAVRRYPRESKSSKSLSRYICTLCLINISLAQATLFFFLALPTYATRPLPLPVAWRWRYIILKYSNDVSGKQMPAAVPRRWSTIHLSTSIPWSVQMRCENFTDHIPGLCMPFSIFFYFRYFGCILLLCSAICYSSNRVFPISYCIYCPLFLLFLLWWLLQYVDV